MQNSDCRCVKEEEQARCYPICLRGGGHIELDDDQHTNMDNTENDFHHPTMIFMANSETMEKPHIATGQFAVFQTLLVSDVEWESTPPGTGCIATKCPWLWWGECVLTFKP